MLKKIFSTAYVERKAAEYSGIIDFSTIVHKMILWIKLWINNLRVDNLWKMWKDIFYPRCFNSFPGIKNNYK